MLNNNIIILVFQFVLNIFVFVCEIYSFDFYKVILLMLVGMVILLLVVVVGNGLVLVVIWRNLLFRIFLYILFVGLVFIDFCIGVIFQLFLVVNELLFDRVISLFVYLKMRVIGDGCFEYFFNLIMLIVIFMFIEWWLYMSW